MKLYKREENATVIVKETPFDGAEEINVMEYAEAVRTLSEFYKSKGETLMDEYACNEKLQKLMQNGDGLGYGSGTEYDETRFHLPYYDEDEQIIYDCFGGYVICQYDKITIDEDGEIEFDNDSPTYLRFA